MEIAYWTHLESSYWWFMLFSYQCAAVLSQHARALALVHCGHFFIKVFIMLMIVAKNTKSEFVIQFLMLWICRLWGVLHVLSMFSFSCAHNLMWINLTLISALGLMLASVGRYSFEWWLHHAWLPVHGGNRSAIILKSPHTCNTGNVSHQAACHSMNSLCCCRWRNQ